MGLEEGYWQDPASHRKLFYRLWRSATAKRLVVVVHGFGEHSGRYDTFAQELAKLGWAVGCADLWGHGQSDGTRGDIDRFDDYLTDLDALIQQVFLPQTRLASYSIFGHSFGGLLGAHWAIRAPTDLKAVILQSALFQIGFPLPPLQEALIRKLAPWRPTWSVGVNLNPAWLSHDPVVVQHYREDPLVHRRMTLRCAVAVKDAMPAALAGAHAIRHPTLVLCGEDDCVVSPAACKQFHEQLRCDKRLRAFPQCYHELHHESVFPAILEEVVSWIQAHG